MNSATKLRFPGKKVVIKKVQTSQGFHAGPLP